MAKRGNKKGSFVLLSVQSDENLILGFEEKTVKVQKLFYVAKKSVKTGCRFTFVCFSLLLF